MQVAAIGGFRPFRVEMAAVAAGWHDGMRATLEAVHAGNRLVVEHEFIHGRIFQETADGQVLSFVLRFLDNATIGEADRVQAETLADVLEASSRTAHEAAATYLSLQLLSSGPDATPALVAPLPQDYQAYQSAFADRFDPIFGSTFLRYLAAWCATSLAFWSPLIEQFATERLALASRLQDGFPSISALTCGCSESSRPWRQASMARCAAGCRRRRTRCAGRGVSRHSTCMTMQAGSPAA
jgi:hypothetical protein